MKTSKKQKKWLNVCLAVIIAFALWFYVVSVENPTGSIHLRDLPVMVQGSETLEENGLTLTGMDRDELTIKATGKRKTLMKLDRKDITLTLDVAGITGPGEWPLTAKVIWPAYVNTEGLSVSDWETLKVVVTIDSLETKDIPVRGEFIGTEADGFLADDVETDPAEIEVTGPASELKDITYALAQVGGESVDETVKKKTTLVLMGPDGLITDLENVTMSERKAAVIVPVRKVVSVPLTVELVDGGGSTAADATVKITPESVVLSEPAEENILPESIRLGSIELGKVYDATSYTFPIELPKGVTGWNVPETASVRVSLERLASRSFAVEDVTLDNIPRGFQAEPVGDSLSIWVRGDPNVVSKLSAEQISVTADLSGAKADEGVQRFPVKIDLQGVEKDAQVGIIGTEYSIAVRLTR